MSKEQLLLSYFRVFSVLKRRKRVARRSFPLRRAPVHPNILVIPAPAPAAQGPQVVVPAPAAQAPQVVVPAQAAQAQVYVPAPAAPLSAPPRALQGLIQPLPPPMFGFQVPTGYNQAPPRSLHPRPRLQVATGQYHEVRNNRGGVPFVNLDPVEDYSFLDPDLAWDNQL